MHIEDELKQALRAEDPGAAFTQRVLARAREERSRTAASTLPSASAATAKGVIEGRDTAGAEAPIATRSAAWRSASHVRRLIAAVAASLALSAAGLQYWRHAQYVAEGERARAQVLAALRLTSEKLNQVHDAITESTEAR